MVEAYLRVKGSKYRLFYVYYRETPDTNVYDKVIFFDPFSRSKEPDVSHTSYKLYTPSPILEVNANEMPPFDLYSTNEFLTPAYRHAVEVHRKSGN